MKKVPMEMFMLNAQRLPVVNEFYSSFSASHHHHLVFLLAINTVNALHGRFFSGRTVVGNYIPTQSYHKLFPASSSATTPLTTSYQ